MAENTTSTRLEQLKLCLRASASCRRDKNPQGCLAAALKAVNSVDSFSVRAHRNICWSLFALHHYRACLAACATAVQMLDDDHSISGHGLVACREPERRGERLLLRKLQYACWINERLQLRQNPNEQTAFTLTDRLIDGWYSARLLEFVSTNVLQPLDLTLSEQNDGGGGAGAGMGDCCLVEMPNADFKEWDQERINGGERTIAVQDVMKGFPLDQATGGTIYKKDSITPFSCQRTNSTRNSRVNINCYHQHDKGPCRYCISSSFPIPTFPFPEWCPHPNPHRETTSAPDNTTSTSRVQSVPEGQSPMDVYYGRGLVPQHVQNTLRARLDELADIRQDFPVPMYQNIIDPNIGSVDGVWVPTEFDIQEVRRVLPGVVLTIQLWCHKVMRGEGQILPSKVAHMIASFAGGTCMPIAQAKAVISSNMPDINPHNHTQLYIAVEQVMEAAVPLLVKLKRPSLLLPGPLQAVVKAQRIFVKDGKTYSGVWHEDGMRESVVAVVLYYYRVDSCLEGGNMEIASKQTRVIGYGDWDAPVPTPEEFLETFPRCSVPIEEGTLLVFSNYAYVHRVLPMICSKSSQEGDGSDGFRDFLAFFIIDQRSPLPVPSDLGPIAIRKRQRLGLLQQQLEPRGKFGMSNDNVYSTGNGSPFDLGWIRGQDSSLDHRYCPNDVMGSNAVVGLVSSMNVPPQTASGRGVSATLVDGVQDFAVYNPESSWSQHAIKGEERAVWANGLTYQLNKEYPGEGVSEYKNFESRQEWDEHVKEIGFYWS